MSQGELELKIFVDALSDIYLALHGLLNNALGRPSHFLEIDLPSTSEEYRQTIKRNFLSAKKIIGIEPEIKKKELALAKDRIQTVFAAIDWWEIGKDDIGNMSERDRLLTELLSLQEEMFQNFSSRAR